MAVVIDELVTQPAVQKERGAEPEAGGGEGAEQPSEHDIERIVEMQANRYERIRAY